MAESDTIHLELQRISGSEYGDRRRAEERLARQFRSCPGVLLPALGGDDVGVRRCAIEILRRIAVESGLAREMLEARLEAEPDVKTRRRLAAAIGQAGDPRSVEVLQAQLAREPHRYAQASLILALGRLGFSDFPRELGEGARPGGPIDEALRKVRGKQPAQVVAGCQASACRPAGDYLIQSYPGLERAALEECRSLGIAGGEILGDGWCRVAPADPAILASLRTILGDFHLAASSQADAVADGELLRAAVESIGTAASAAGSGSGLAFRLALPWDSSKNAYVKRVSSLARSIEQETGWQNRPSDYDIDLRIVSAGGQRAAIWRDRRWPGPPFREGRRVVPASIHPSVAAALVRMALQHRGDELAVSDMLDPCCGSGTIVVEWLCANPESKAVGLEQSGNAAAIARANLRHFGMAARVREGDMARMPFRDASFDVIIGNLPFGVRTRSSQPIGELYGKFLREVRRVLRGGGVLVCYTGATKAFERAVRELCPREAAPQVKLVAGGMAVAVYCLRAADFA